MFLKPGSFTSGESEQVLEVGPSTPATKRGLFFVENSSQVIPQNVCKILQVGIIVVKKGGAYTKNTCIYRSSAM
jgi:hypothetical protein